MIEVAYCAAACAARRVYIASASSRSVRITSFPRLWTTPARGCSPQRGQQRRPNRGGSGHADGGSTPQKKTSIAPPTRRASRGRARRAARPSPPGLELGVLVEQQEGLPSARSASSAESFLALAAALAQRDHLGRRRMAAGDVHLSRPGTRCPAPAPRSRSPSSPALAVRSRPGRSAGVHAALFSTTQKESRRARGSALRRTGAAECARPLDLLTKATGYVSRQSGYQKGRCPVGQETSARARCVFQTGHSRGFSAHEKGSLGEDAWRRRTLTCRRRRRADSVIVKYRYGAATKSRPPPPIAPACPRRSASGSATGAKVVQVGGDAAAAARSSGIAPARSSTRSRTSSCIRSRRRTILATAGPTGSTGPTTPTWTRREAGTPAGCGGFPAPA